MFLNAKSKFSDEGNLGIARTPVSFLGTIELVCNKEMVISIYLNFRECVRMTDYGVTEMNDVGWQCTTCKIIDE